MSLRFTFKPETEQQLTTFELPDEIGFCKYTVPIMAVAHYRDGIWQDAQITDFAPLQISPDCLGLHYGQVIFEGMKAFYDSADHCAVCFRWQQHWARLNESAKRLAMPEVPQPLFQQLLFTLVAKSQSYLPTGVGDALYLRPLMFASGNGLGFGKNDSFTLIIIAAPTAQYFNAPLNVYVEREYRRACEGGVGGAKMAGNYGATYLASQKAQQHGCQQTLWLDAKEGRYIEEFSAMNFFAVFDNEIVTPRLTGTILPGVTRDSVIEIAKKLDIQICERAVSIEELTEQIQSGNCQEVFACGTGATLIPVASLNDGSSVYELGEWKFTQKLKDALQTIQHGQGDKHFDSWITRIQF
ncbi:branched-chain amino acid aminotransferase [Pseudoalteromonas viridis]|uniref:Branched-chain-amino-acid aminotransferase n=1 Tax=Pseudoalteromonas viridis TaxID=339617 RepID=A0ABX7V709_9GAMM|nr:branched-chain amino acid aminotransferase [Pseudoalteromonas viridis]QTL36666.1 branched-chain amino acid aminotransferase [Pseudoalteromonas viridis]